MPAPKKKAAAKPAAKAAPKAAPKAADNTNPPKKGVSLVIVESPAKQRTISRFLKKGYHVASSYGHVRDLPEKKLGVDEEKDFEPSYLLLARTRKILPELKKLAKEAATVYLATDHDREGESIAWHLSEILDLEPARIKRITFHEITPSAIAEALRSPRDVDMSLVQAQQARRVIDRLVGYKLSPLLWRKIRRGLSAGRVQSVAARLIVEREREIRSFQSEGYWTLKADLAKPGESPQFEARLTQWKGQKVESTRTFELFAEEYRVKATSFKTKEDIDAVLAAVGGKPFSVVSVERKEVSRRPAPPFITSTLQQAASQKLGFTAERTMRIAQSLYEGVDIGADEPVGLITYMRTDSFTVAKTAQEEAKEYLTKELGREYVPPEFNAYDRKVAGAQEAHEAIRPTSVLRTPDSLRAHLAPEQFRLYQLVWKRFLASQMTAAVFDTVAADIRCGEALFHATGRTLKFDGFLRVWLGSAAEETDKEEDEEEEGRLPPLAEGDALKVEGLLPEEHKTSPPPYYNEASLIRALERHGIGRPSTYAPTIQTIVNRGYVRRGLKDRRLLPTDLGMLVVEKLNAHFPDQLSLSYTAEVEGELDRVAEGKDSWQKVVRGFYDPFHKALRKAAETMEDSRLKPQETDEICPLCGAKLLIRESRFGKYLSCSQFPKCKGKMQLDADGKKVVPQETDEKCEVCGKPMVIRLGRRGKFLACSGYPACRNTFSLDADGKKIVASRPVVTSRKCNKCGSAFWMRLGKRGFFLACSAFPRCRNLKPISKDDAEALRAEAGVAAPKAPEAGRSQGSGGGIPSPEGSVTLPRPPNAAPPGEPGALPPAP